MWDHICVFSKTGVILWQRSMQKLRSVGSSGMSPIGELVRTVLLEDKAGQSAIIESYALKWVFENELDLVVVIVYQKLLQCVYAEELLESVKSQFVKIFGADLLKQVQGGRGCINCAGLPLKFDKHFDKCLARVENKSKSARARDGKGRHSTAGEDGEGEDGDADEDGDDDGNGSPSPSESASNGAAGDDETDAQSIASARARLAARAGRRGKGRPVKTNSGGGSSGNSDPQGEAMDRESGKKKSAKKEGTVWRDGSNLNKKISKSEAASLDFSKKKQGGDDEAGLSEDDLRLKEYQEKYLPDQGEVAEWDEDEEGEDEDEDDSGDDASGGAQKSRGKSWFGKSNLGSFLQSITGNKVLDKDDLAPVLDQMRNQLIGKNVAAEIADNICASVAASLDGQKLASFSRVESTVVASLKAAVLRVLTPRKSTDILHEIRQHKGSGNPYVIAFVGINGVGKSTSLAKVCYYLKQNGIKVSIAACDTFRSGAVEQLRSHARCLDVPLFERGYLKVRRVKGRWCAVKLYR